MGFHGLPPSPPPPPPISLPPPPPPPPPITIPPAPPQTPPPILQPPPSPPVGPPPVESPPPAIPLPDDPNEALSDVNGFLNNQNIPKPQDIASDIENIIQSLLNQLLHLKHDWEDVFKMQSVVEKMLRMMIYRAENNINRLPDMLSQIFPIALGDEGYQAGYNLLNSLQAPDKSKDPAANGTDLIKMMANHLGQPISQSLPGLPNFQAGLSINENAVIEKLKPMVDTLKNNTSTDNIEYAAILDIIKSFQSEFQQVLQNTAPAISNIAGEGYKTFKVIMDIPWYVPGLSELYAYETHSLKNPAGLPFTFIGAVSFAIAYYVNHQFGNQPFSDSMLDSIQNHDFESDDSFPSFPDASSMKELFNSYSRPPIDVPALPKDAVAILMVVMEYVTAGAQLLVHNVISSSPKDSPGIYFLKLVPVMSESVSVGLKFYSFYLFGTPELPLPDRPMDFSKGVKADETTIVEDYAELAVEVGIAGLKYFLEAVSFFMEIEQSEGETVRPIINTCLGGLAELLDVIDLGIKESILARKYPPELNPDKAAFITGWTIVNGADYIGSFMGDYTKLVNFLKIPALNVDTFAACLAAAEAIETSFPYAAVIIKFGTITVSIPLIPDD